MLRIPVFLYVAEIGACVTFIFRPENKTARKGYKQDSRNNNEKNICLFSPHNLCKYNITRTMVPVDCLKLANFSGTNRCENSFFSYRAILFNDAAGVLEA